MATLNIGMKVNRAITGATTVSANAYAMVTYILTAASGTVAGSGTTLLMPLPITRHFGPGQSIPSSFTTSGVGGSAGAYAMGGTLTWTLQSGVELINTI